MKVYVAMFEEVGQMSFGTYIKDVYAEYSGCPDIYKELDLYKSNGINPREIGHNARCLGLFLSKKDATKFVHDYLLGRQNEYYKNDCCFTTKERRHYGNCIIYESMNGVTVECAWVEAHTL